MVLNVFLFGSKGDFLLIILINGRVCLEFLKIFLFIDIDLLLEISFVRFFFYENIDI